MDHGAVVASFRHQRIESLDVGEGQILRAGDRQVGVLHAASGDGRRFVELALLGTRPQVDDALHAGRLQIAELLGGDRGRQSRSCRRGDVR